MIEKILISWEDFEDELTGINEETKSLQEKEQGHVSYPLFRGVNNSEYHLESTLDRIQKEMSVSDYQTILEIVHKHVATCTGRKWDLNEEINYERGFKLPAYGFMAYLRHNGFPSPLIDWTRSPYIAAFFAFRKLHSIANHKEYVSIYVYREYCGTVGKGWLSNEPHVHTLGSTIATDSKHYLQQSEYSFCIKKKSGDKWVYANHEDITPYMIEDTPAQDDLAKYTIPVSEQKKVLKKLDSMNITAYSLFNSEPSLMETLALREIVFEMENRLLASKDE